MTTTIDHTLKAAEIFIVNHDYPCGQQTLDLAQEALDKFCAWYDAQPGSFRSQYALERIAEIDGEATKTVDSAGYRFMAELFARDEELFDLLTRSDVATGLPIISLCAPGDEIFCSEE